MANGNDPANIAYIIAENGFYYVAYKEKVKVPEIVVSAKGVANGLSEEYNDGWDFGPDSYDPNSTANPPYTQTSGIQEAHLYRVSLAQQLPSGTPYSFIPKVMIMAGTYVCNEDIVVYPNNNGVLSRNNTLPFEGQGRNSVTQIYFQGNAKYGFDFSGATAGTNIHLSHMYIGALGSNTSLTSLINAQLPAGGGNYITLDDVQLATQNTTSPPQNGIMISGIAFIYANGFSSEIGGTPLCNFINLTGGATGDQWMYMTGLRGSNVNINIGAGFGSVYLNFKTAIHTINVNVPSGDIIHYMEIDGAAESYINVSDTSTVGILRIKGMALDAQDGWITNAGTIERLILEGYIYPAASSGNAISNSGTINFFENKAYTAPNGTFSTSFVNSSTAGTTAGTVSMTWASFGPNYKKLLITFSGYENDTTTNQTIDFPLAFSSYAGISLNTTGLTISASTSGITITAPDSTTTYSGIVIVEGY